MQLFKSKLQETTISEDWEERSLYEQIVEAELLNSLEEKITKKTPMGDVVKDFYKSDAPQFKGKSKAKRRQMAIAAKLSKMDEKEQPKKEKPEDMLKGFDPKTARALMQLKTKYPQADNVLSALLADVEKNEKDSDVADLAQDDKIEKLIKAVDILQKEIKLLKGTKQ